MRAGYGMSKMLRSFCLIFLVFLVLSSCRNSSKPSPPPPVVSVSKITQRDVPVYIDAIGQSISPVTVDIRPQVAGKLLEVFVGQGDFVKAGQVLYKVDPRPYLAVLDQAKAALQRDLAQLALAQSTVKRYRSVVESDFISQLAFEQYTNAEKAAQAQVDQDLAAIRAAELNVNFCSIVAPVTGKISFFAVDVGNIVAIDDAKALTSIRPQDPIDILFSISQQQFESIRKSQGDLGQWAFTALLPESGKLIPGTTYFIDNQLNQDTGTLLIKGRLPNKELLFWPGEYVKVQVLQKIAKKALIVPPGAILIGNKGFYLYRMNRDNVVQMHAVEIVYRTDDFVALYSKELHPDDTIVIDGQINISPGMKVNPRQ